MDFNGTTRSLGWSTINVSSEKLKILLILCFSQRGIKQAQEVGERLSKEDKISYIFVSPFIRCLQTATNIVSKLPNGSELKFYVEPGFIEALSCTQFPPGCLTAKQLK